jgi:hypothetical protein
MLQLVNLQPLVAIPASAIEQPANMNVIVVQSIEQSD